MGIHQKTKQAIPAAALNKRLRTAANPSDEYASSGRGGRGDAPKSMRLWFVDTPIGPALAGGVGGALGLLTFPTDETLRKANASREALCEYIAKITRRFTLPVSSVGMAPADPLASQLARELDEWFAGARRDFETPLVLRGTPFQRSAWEALRAIPYGTVRSYGDLARSLGKPEAARATGAASGRNPVAIIVPCHRVIGANGSLTGYAGGLERKQFLLALEQSNAPQAQGALFGESMASIP